MTANGSPQTLDERIDRLESLDAIRQLPHRYALAVDTRNIDVLVGLFVEEVQVGKGLSGREALKQWFTQALIQAKTTIHFVGNHIIDFESADRARGVVYCRDEAERPTDWGVGYLQYWDSYVRHDGRWYFERRRFHRWFMVDALTRPSHGAGVIEGGKILPTGLLPDAWPSWGEFWQRVNEKRADQENR